MNSHKILLSFSFVLIFVLSGNAQWKEINVPYGYAYSYSYVDQLGDIFLETQEDIYYSNDLGLSWYKTDFKTVGTWNGLNTIIELANHDLLLSHLNDVYKFDKSVKKWIKVITGLNQLINIDHQGKIWFKSNDINKNGVYFTLDLGVTYTYIECPDVFDQYTEIYVDSYLGNNIMHYHNKTENKIYHFSDTGVFEFITNSTDKNIVFCNQNKSTVIFLNANEKLCRSTDYGKSFTQIDYDFSIFFTTPNICQLINGDILLWSDYDFYISKDDGKNWKKLSETLANPLPSYYTTSSMGYGKSGNQVILIDRYCQNQGIYITENQGTTWSLENTHFYYPEMNKIVEDKAGNLYTFTCSDTTALYSQDKGKSWNRFTVKVNNLNYAVKDIATNDIGHIYAVTNFAIYKSIDGGKSFSGLGSPFYVFYDGQRPNIFISPKGSIYLKSTYYAAISNDNGTTWQTLSNCPMGSYHLQLDANDYIYYITQGGIFIKYNPSLDIFEEFEINKDYTIQDFVILNNGRIYFTAVNKTTSQFSLGYSDDLMKTFELIPNSPSILNMFSDVLSNLYTVTKDGIYKYNDKANSFDYFTTNPDTTQNAYFYVSRYQNLYSYNTYAKIFAFENKLASYELLTGFVFSDTNLDCIDNQNELHRNWVKVSADGSASAISYTSNNGKYILRLPEGNYNCIASSPNPLWQSCSPINITLIANQIDTPKVNLGLQPTGLCPYLSIHSELPILRACRKTNLFIKYCNNGTIDANNVKVKVLLSDKLQYLTSTYPIFSQNGQELIFDIGMLPAGTCGDLIIYTQISCDVQVGETICIESSIEPKELCTQNFPDSYYSNRCVNAVASYDPNTKTAYINGKPANGKTEMNQDVEYVIRFQNTGSDTAFRVVVSDDIPKGYDISTLKPLNSSHPCNIEIVNNRTVKFIFDPIMLPDSNINEPASHGFIAFKISPNKDLPYGTNLDNIADIFFDFNTAITTNTAYLTVSNTTQNIELTNKLQFTYYPNPYKRELFIHIENSKQHNYRIELTDILSNKIFSTYTNGPDYLLNLKEPIAPGIYIIKVIDSEGIFGTAKLIVQ